jgi:hypothetical protein
LSRVEHKLVVVVVVVIPLLLVFLLARGILEVLVGTARRGG